ncbi:MAG: hypothetical protein IJ105_00580 [Bacilli bacterium]|nr:hypothetical protein [Bacilli bacterium]
MKNRNYYLQRIKSFSILSGVYYRRLQRGMTISQLISQLDNEIFLYECSKTANDLDLLHYTGFIEKDEDIEENYYALAKAYFDFTQKLESGKEIIDEYILKMTTR